MEKVTTMGIDLAKSVFSLHGVDGAGHVVLKRTVRRDQLLEVVAGCELRIRGVTRQAQPLACHPSLSIKRLAL